MWIATLLRAGRPQLAPLLAALASVALALAAANHALSPEHLRTLDPEALRTSVEDDAGMIAGTLMRPIQWNTHRVVALGGSAMREAAPDQMLVLAGSGQTLTESYAILEALTAPESTVVLLHLTPHRLAALVTDASEEVNRTRMPAITGTGVRDALAARGVASPKAPALLQNRAWASRWIRGRLNRHAVRCLLGFACAPGTLLIPLPRYGYHHYADLSLSAAEKDSLARLEGLQLSFVSDGDIAFGGDLLAGLSALSAKRGWLLYLVTLPADPRVRAIEARFYARQATVDALARASGARRLDMRLDEKSFTSDDFVDLHHVRPSGARKLAAGFFGLGS